MFPIVPADEPAVHPDAGPPPPAPPAAFPEPPFSELFAMDPTAVTDERLQDIMNRHVAYEVEKTNLHNTHTVLQHEDRAAQHANGAAAPLIGEGARLIRNVDMTSVCQMRPDAGLSRFL